MWDSSLWYENYYLAFKIQGDFSQPTQASSATNTFGKHSNLFLQDLYKWFTTVYFFCFFVFKIYSQSFLTFFLYWCLEVGSESIYCLVLIKTGLPRAMEKITTSGPHCQHWNLIKRKSFPSEKKSSMNQGLEISSTSLFLCEMSIKCFEIIILFLLHIIFVILSKPCHMLDKRGLGNSGQTYHIIESVLVVAAFQISPGTRSSFH